MHEQRGGVLHSHLKRAQLLLQRILAAQRLLQHIAAAGRGGLKGLLELGSLLLRRSQLQGRLLPGALVQLLKLRG